VLHIFIDADACPVKDEVYRVARRYELSVSVVANAPMRIPEDARVELVVVRDGLDAADDWIAANVSVDDVVITADIPLAWRCLEKGARVVGTTGRPFTDDNIGDAMATRELMSELRNAGSIVGGPAPFQKRDSSRFLQEMDRVIGEIRRRRDQTDGDHGLRGL
jgi:uncharacterized protein YaiI (UPF0178 family)